MLPWPVAQVPPLLPSARMPSRRRGRSTRRATTVESMDHRRPHRVQVIPTETSRDLFT